ncbi:ead/Ea22-like family protein [Escherichia coli]|uniref:Ead/Ea22-like family protein n=1 Tax=Escherichia coli TaxID=562 RepID=A0A2H4TM44_ECOLX|nr:ead/Ea22-like family protein [Escherichia coli]KDZ20414.1 ead/Ea22-like family protein [Escherichia coli 3-020-07_S1_C1]KDZ22546.1 ead/Ea22-like family protein [Escherichia coli 3-020-07_S1_C2]KDZ33449.1 ead/Ea22-like family protein [Escherichia coli 3-020-07_S1_C3]EEU9340896.1 ead/Ea22-like family protein [Escherichia coli]
MSKIDYQVLRAKAEKATKGSYIVGHTSVNQYGNLTGVFVCQKWKGEPGGVIAECHANCLVETDAQAYANAAFIAEANPATVLALLDERERNQQYIKRRDQENEEIALTVGKLRVELEAAKSKLNEQREYYEGVIADGSKRIAELEAREIKPAKGEVLVVVSGFTGCGKSAIAGEIEIAMKAIGVPVQWTNGDAEKRMTGADWLTAIEMYKPTVRIVEVNVPRAAGIRIKGEEHGNKTRR